MKNTEPKNIHDFLTNSDIEFLISLTRQAGKAILSTLELKVVSKKDDSPLTLADTASHNCIMEALKNRFPKIPIISEELSEQVDFEKRKDWQTFWLVDPLDGTKEFIAGLPEFTVNIALVNKNVPIAGFIFAPKMDLVYYGCAGQGSFKIQGAGKPERINSSIKVEDPVAVVSRSHLDSATKEFLVSKKITRSTGMGSSLKFCLLADGTAHVYPRLAPIMEWDTAAGDAIYRYSGVSSPRNSPLKYNTPTLKFEKFVIGED